MVSCFFTPVLVKYIGVKWALIFGTAGYAPYAAGLYCNNRFGNEWFVLLGASLCGISAGVFWAVEAAIALSVSASNLKQNCLTSNSTQKHGIKVGS